MKTLVIDTATPACSVAIFSDGEMVVGFYEEIGRGHAERLIPLIAQLPDRGRADQIYVNIGPGSFTGIRVGISAARALALAWGVSCHGYSTLALVAAMAKESADNEVSTSQAAIDSVMVGGHGEFFHQTFDASITSLTSAQSLTPEEVSTAISSSIIAGSGADNFATKFPDAQIMKILPDARRWRLISHLKPLKPSALYIRAADAKPAKPRT